LLASKQLLAEPGLAERVAALSRGNARNALRLMRNVHLVARSAGATALTHAHFQKACELEGIDALGLDALERSYLQLLSSTSSPLRPCAAAAHLELPLVTIQQVIEPYLLRLGYIERAVGGRRLTARGRAYLSGGAAAVSDKCRIPVGKPPDSLRRTEP
jgi:holliday junction DNA helicase RuvB